MTIHVGKFEEVCSLSSSKQCTTTTCFNFSKCKISDGFKVFFYDNNPHFDGYGYKTENPKEACLYVVDNYNENFATLSFWNEGENHIIFAENLSSRTVVKWNKMFLF